MSHTYTRLLYHIVFSTNGRHALITEDWRADLHSYLGGIITNIEGKALSIGGVADHFHILASIPAKLSLSDAVRTIKSNSSKWAHETKAIPVFQWQEGYSAFTVSESNRETVKRYIVNQEEHHRRMPYQDELVALLRKHGIEFDETTLWD